MERKSHPNDWTRNKRKESCQSGKLYTSSCGVLKGPPVPVDIGDHTGCRFKRIQKIPQEKRILINVLGKRLLDETKILYCQVH